MAKDHYPEHAKLSAVKGESQAIGQFLDTLSAQGLSLCRHREAGNNGKPQYAWKRGVTTSRRLGGKRINRKLDVPTWADEINGDAIYNPEFDEWDKGYYHDTRTIEKILAEYFEIDLAKLEDEKRAMLDEQRALNEKEEKPCRNKSSKRSTPSAS